MHPRIQSWRMKAIWVTAMCLYNEGVNGLYWIHQMDYEQTQLRKIYKEHMRELQPTWDAEVAGGALKNDFMEAVNRCAAGYWLRSVWEWIDAIEKGG